MGDEGALSLPAKSTAVTARVKSTPSWSPVARTVHISESRNASRDTSPATATRGRVRGARVRPRGNPAALYAPRGRRRWATRNCPVYPVTADKPQNKRAMVVKALAAATVSTVVTVSRHHRHSGSLRAIVGSNSLSLRLRHTYRRRGRADSWTACPSAAFQVPPPLADGVSDRGRDRRVRFRRLVRAARRSGASPCVLG